MEIKIIAGIMFSAFAVVFGMYVALYQENRKLRNRFIRTVSGIITREEAEMASKYAHGPKKPNKAPREVLVDVCSDGEMIATARCMVVGNNYRLNLPESFINKKFWEFKE